MYEIVNQPILQALGVVGKNEVINVLTKKRSAKKYSISEVTIESDWESFTSRILIVIFPAEIQVKFVENILLFLRILR